MKSAKDIAKGIGGCVNGAAQCVASSCSCAVKVVAYSVADLATGGHGISQNANREAVKECKDQLRAGSNEIKKGVDRIKNNEKYKDKTESEILLEQVSKGYATTDEYLEARNREAYEELRKKK